MLNETYRYAQLHFAKRDLRVASYTQRQPSLF